MTWLLIIIVLIALWVIELTFGWLFGAQLLSLVMLVALIYLGLTVNKLQNTQTELQKELKRLWKTVKALQPNSSSVAPGTLEREQVQSSPFAESVNVFDQNASETETALTEVIWANKPGQVNQPETEDTASFEPAFTQARC